MPVDLVTRGGSGTTATTSIYTVVPFILLKDSFGVTWKLTVGINGNLTTTPSSGPAFPFFVLQDTTLVYWKIFLTGSNGTLDTDPSGIAALSLGTLFMTDANNRNWFIAITPSGSLNTI